MHRLNENFITRIIINLIIKDRRKEEEEEEEEAFCLKLSR